MYTSSSTGNPVKKIPQRKFAAAKKRSSSNIRQPREVEGRHDIELLFEDMTMNDLTKVVEKGNLNAVMELQQIKIQQSRSSRNPKIKEPKNIENEDFQEHKNFNEEDK